MSKHTQVRASVRRRKVAHIAAISRRSTVNNCTIPAKVDNPTPYNDKTINAAYEWYDKVREERIAYMKKHFSGKKQRNQRKNKRSWYMLTKGKCYNYEQRATSYGMCTDYFPVPSETQVLNQKNQTKKLNHTEYMEARVQYKLKQWEVENPCPVITDGSTKDLFEEQYLPQWKKAREEAEEHIRDLVVSMYHKLKIVGNKVDYSKGKMRPEVIATVKDEDMKGHHVVHPKLKTTDKLYIKATNAAQNAMDKDSAIVDADLLNHKETEKRPLIQAKRQHREAA